jgi:hypothetical protein
VDCEGVTRPSCPVKLKARGSQFLLAAATAIRPATKELPRREPATTRQISAAARKPKVRPRRRVIAVCKGSG